LELVRFPNELSAGWSWLPHGELVSCWASIGNCSAKIDPQRGRQVGFIPLPRPRRLAKTARCDFEQAWNGFAGSVLETQSVHLQASVLPVGTLVPLPALWHFNEAGMSLRCYRQAEL
jgi:hypothetical protein